MYPNVYLLVGRDPQFNNILEIAEDAIPERWPRMQSIAMSGNPSACYIGLTDDGKKQDAPTCTCGPGMAPLEGAGPTACVAAQCPQTITLPQCVHR